MPVQRSVTTLKWQHRNYGSDPWTNASMDFGNSDDLQLSSNHYPLQTEMDDGGSFLLNKIKDSPVPGVFSGSVPGFTVRYLGEFTVGNPYNWTLGSVSPKTNTALNALGSTAMARVNPVNPTYSLSTALGELASDGLPTIAGLNLLKERSKRARASGSEYLNVQFGWLPLISDVRSFAKAVRDSHEILESYRKDSGKKVRRRYEFPGDGITTREFKGSFFAHHSSLNTFGSGVAVEQIEKKSWFSGAFKYHIPTGPTQLNKFQEWRSMADHLLGVNVTPETLWNIAPWSWAIDWFSNTGDVMTNISNLGRDGMVMQYGYIMDYQKWSLHSQASFTYNGMTRSTSRLRSNEWKVRLPATPFGFGVDLKALTAKQVSILVALGLSRS